MLNFCKFMFLSKKLSYAGSISQNMFGCHYKSSKGCHTDFGKYKVEYNYLSFYVSYNNMI